MFSLRPATAADVTLVLDFIKQLAAYERLLDSVVATEAGLRDTLFGSHPAAEVIIAEANGQPAGFAVYFHSYSTFLGRRNLYLEDLFVLPAWRSQGLGRLLLAAVARVAVERDCGRMEWSVLKWNEPALGVYRRIGAVPMDEWVVQRLDGDQLRALASASPR